MALNHSAASVSAALGAASDPDAAVRLGDYVDDDDLPSDCDAGAQGAASEVSGTGVIVQFEGAKRNLTLIFGKHRGDPDDDVFVSNTSGDFDPAPADDDELDDDGESELFGFRRQRVAA